MKLLFFTALIATTAAAQSPADRAITALQSSQTRTKAAAMLGKAMQEQAAPELFPGEFDDVGPQFLLVPNRSEGVGTVNEQKHHWFEAFADTQFYYTSNALLTEKGNSDTGLAVVTLQTAANLPTFDLLGGQVSSKLGYRHQWWMYSLHDSGSQLNNFDFAVSTFFIQTRHSFGEQWAAGLGLDYNRLISHDNDWSEFYTELVPSWYVERNFGFGENALLTAGLYGAYHWTNTDDTVSNINDRLDTSLGVSYSHQITPDVIAQPFYRVQWSHYTENSDRNDVYNTVGFSLSYRINDWSNVRTFISYENRTSTDDTVADYGKWDTGVGLTLSMRF
jgi:hypothetical protein